LIHKITELEALCRKLREDTQRLKKEKDTLKGMVESHDELLMEIAKETDLTTWERMKMMKRKKRTPTMKKMPPHPPATAPEEIDDEGPMEVIPEQEAPVLHEVVLADAEPEMPQLRLYHALMRDYEEHPLRMEDDFDDSDDDPNEGCSDMDEWFPED
jgi:hypothetical protein